MIAVSGRFRTLSLRSRVIGLAPLRGVDLPSSASRNRISMSEDTFSRLLIYVPKTLQLGGLSGGQCLRPSSLLWAQQTNVSRHASVGFR